MALVNAIGVNRIDPDDLHSFRYNCLAAIVVVSNDPVGGASYSDRIVFTACILHLNYI